ncbi:hypothetical protein G8C92_02635 [Paenibacillus donghaensis]|uniref:hypothetical protein n=1 Tax=Paenibacillus donghaensis TaxID=414771 RepID=UPI001883F67C|nr:hypothetical protein [Paenibacillus donghaensis]MBE9912932.1 hypothetical protein [Paenibacillus donghaensis]
MKNSPSRFELYFSLLFILALLISAAAFLSGVHIGANRTEEKYNQLKLSSLSPDFTDSYQQQDVVTFYHTVFLPYREFKQEWLSGTDNQILSAKDFKQLAKLANDSYNEVLQASVFDSSPLLQQSQNNTLKSLHLFGTAASQAAENSTDGKMTAVRFTQDPFYQNAVKYGLMAQKQYYASMLKWGTKVSPSIPGQYSLPSTLKLDEWKKLPLMVKNEAVSAVLLNSSYFSAADPQDITAVVDYWLASGKAKQYKLDSLQATVKHLQKTDAIRPQIFCQLKEQYGQKELLPQIPFFDET